MTTFQGGKVEFIQGPMSLCLPINIANDLISECFIPDPGWSGTEDVVSGEVVVNSTGNQEDYWEGLPTPFSFDEVWGEAQVTVDSGAALNSGEHIQLFGFPNGTATICGVGLINDGGTLKFSSYHRTDSISSINAVIASPAFVADQQYTMTCYFLKSSGANDGIVRLWIDTTLAFEITGLDNDVNAATRIGFGDGTTATGVTVTIRGDNCFAGTTGTAPV